MSVIRGPKITYDIPPVTIGQYIFDSVTEFQNLISQIDATTVEGVSETFASIKQKSVRAALQFKKHGMKSSDVVAFCSLNSIPSVIATVATFYLAARVVNFDPMLSQRHTEHLLSVVPPQWIFVVDTSVDLISRCVKNLEVMPKIVVFGKSKKNKKFQSFDDFLVKSKREVEEVFEPTEVDLGDDAVYIFSSGSSGLPKPVIHSHRSFLHMIIPLYKYKTENVVLSITTNYWITGLLILVASFGAANCRVFCQQYQKDNIGEHIFQVIARHKVGILFCDPNFTYKLTSVSDTRRYDITSLRLLLTGGSVMAITQFLKLAEIFPTTTISNVYGMTEVGTITAFDELRDMEFIKNNHKSCGKLMPGLKMKIVDLQDGHILGPNLKGDIRIKSPAIMTGYHSGVDDAYDEEGFFKTFDIGYYDEEHCVYWLDSLSEMFKVEYWHIIPTFIEQVLLDHPAVEQAIVLSVPHGEEGFVPGAVVVLKKNVLATVDEIHSFVEKRVTENERLVGGIRIVKELPMSPTGKVLRSDVKWFLENANK